MDNLDAKFTEILTKIEAVAPQAYNVSLEAIRYDAIGYIAFCFFVLIASAVSLYVSAKLYAKANGNTDKQAVPAFIWGISLLFFICGLLGLISYWRWIAMFNPELFLAKKVLGL